MSSTAVLVALLGGATAFWSSTVNQVVSEPYLDEIFHIPQAQAYCARQWHVWDPKLTTPPGLYIFSFFVHWIGHQSCSVNFLRSLNAFINSILIPLVLVYIIHSIRRLVPGGPSTKQARVVSSDVEWTAFNIGLFPLIFFFSALYYTDVASTLSVLICYSVHLQRRERDLWGWHCPLIVKDIILVVCNFIALSFRQTNVFWVCAFLGALDVVKSLEVAAKAGEDLQDSSYAAIVSRSWTSSRLYDPLAGEASLEDYVKACLSIAVTACANLDRVLRALLPYLVTLAGFIGFVIWNGGVVLGDKSNHIVTLHLPQMLYIWAFFTFFSWPHLYSTIVNAVVPSRLIPGPLRSSTTARPLPHMLILSVVLAVMLAVVHFNTFAHPFTLSDNRHYVFYMFRWFLLRHRLFKYLATPIYLLCGWNVIQALGEDGGQKSAESSPDARRKALRGRGRHQGEMSGPQNRVSFVLIWLLSTALALITVPLVEPRYFIIPWVIWRLHLPAANLSPVGEWLNSRPAVKRWVKNRHIDMHRLGLETLWFMAINAVTGYVFLYRGFEWRQEPGAVQRFMW